MLHEPPGLQAAARDFDAEAVVATAIAIQQIPAPTFDERARGAFVAEQLRAYGLHEVSTDALGNVYACRPGAGPQRPGLMIAAHLDTVFPAGTDLSVRREGARVYGPGLGDNSLGVAALLHLAQALQQHDLAHAGAIWFVANVGEEGLGDLRGMRAAVDRLGQRVGAAIALEGTGPDRIIHAGLGVRRYRIGAAAAGGHSWADFGAPSAVHALVRLAARLSRLEASKEPRSSFNIGTIAGGSSVNTIAASASLLLDLRSTAPRALQALVDQVERALADARAAEPGVEFALETVGDRPAGSIPASHALVRAAVAAYRAEGFAAALDIASTDANIPLSRGIPAVCVGVGDGENEHRLDEYIVPARIPAGMRALLRLALQAAGAR
ncbi:M20/M25/M40 family metallo-hydrolase [Kouleothrix sp.]|uniref:M20/M25/M40 family metallo-hydrolase n=1 Tax=Kouleothrix sp. TaxID=2779161 RepID=UPI00391BFB70